MRATDLINVLQKVRSIEGDCEMCIVVDGVATNKLGLYAIELEEEKCILMITKEQLDMIEKETDATTKFISLDGH